MAVVVFPPSPPPEYFKSKNSKDHNPHYIMTRCDDLRLQGNYDRKIMIVC